MKLITILLTDLVLVECWNHVAHKIIASVALDTLPGYTKRFLRHGLGLPAESFSNGFCKISSWADHEAASGMEMYHYAHTAYRNCEAKYSPEDDCNEGKCIITGLKKFITEAIDLSLSEAQRNVALKMVVHLIADMHQPLHLGFKEDFGGNKIALKYSDTTISLHEFWDSTILSLATHQAKWWDGAKIAAEFLEPDSTGYRIPGGNVVDSIDQAILFMRDDTVKTATCQAYQNAAGEWLSDQGDIDGNYISKSIEIIKIQIAKSIIRTAQILTDMSTIFWRRRKELIVPTLLGIPQGHSVEMTNVFQVLSDLEEEQERSAAPDSTLDDDESDSSIVPVTLSLSVIAPVPSAHVDSLPDTLKSIPPRGIEWES